LSHGLLPSLELPQARAQLAALVPDQKVIAIEEFFEVLRDYGTWLDSDRYGHVFCPHPDVVGVDFQPYMRGHWTMSEFGWTFVSSSKISWVTDHYGRWVEGGPFEDLVMRWIGWFGAAQERVKQIQGSSLVALQQELEKPPAAK